MVVDNVINGGNGEYHLSNNSVVKIHDDGIEVINATIELGGAKLDYGHHSIANLCNAVIDGDESYVDNLLREHKSFLETLRQLQSETIELYRGQIANLGDKPREEYFEKERIGLQAARDIIRYGGEELESMIAYSTGDNVATGDLLELKLVNIYYGTIFDSLLLAIDRITGSES